MLSSALTAMDQDLAPQVQQKKEGTTLRIASRTLQTVFGCVSYERRYYTRIKMEVRIATFWIR